MEIKVGGVILNTSSPALLVAEIGGNHNGDLGLAWQMVQAAAAAGAVAIKFQAYHTPEFLSPKSPYYGELAAEELSLDALAGLMAKARKLGLLVGLTVFDRDSLNLAQEAADFIKVSSGDLTHHQLLAQVSTVDLPIFLSTGAATAEEVAEAQEVLAPAKGRLVLLQCTSLYPAPLESVNLEVMVKWLSKGVAAGYSDHALGTEASTMALALGALVVEKHFTTSRSLPGGDNDISIEPEEFKALNHFNSVRGILRGSGLKRPSEAEEPMRQIIRRTLVATSDLLAGHVLQAGDVALKRPAPALGSEVFLAPSEFPKVLGCSLAQNISNGEALQMKHLQTHG